MSRLCSTLFIVTLSFTFLVVGGIAHAALININTASHEELTALTGIGDVKAQAIIDYRSTNGSFQTIEEIQNVSGIGTATFESIKNSITVGTQDTSPENGDAPTNEGSSEESGATSSGGVFIVDTKKISIDIGSDRTVFVGADSIFEAEVFGTVGEPLESPRVVWSFGDGGRKEGVKVLYNFAYPGVYAVIADAASGGYGASDRMIVEAVPAQLSIPNVTPEYIVLRNATDVEVDIGRWLLFGGGVQFMFPENTVLLPESEVYISRTRVGLVGASSNTIALQYPNGLVATAYQEPLFLRTESIASSNAASQQGTRQMELESEKLSTPEASSQIAASYVAQQTAGEDSGQRGGDMWVWLSGVFGLVVVGSGALLYVRSREKGYDVEEIDTT